MWPKEARHPSDAELYKSLEHNPEEAAARGLWSDRAFLAKVWELNPQLKHTQFADYHGHGWNFKAVFKRDRKGNFLDANGAVIPFESINGPLLQRAVREPIDRPEQRAGVPVHMKDIHLEKGMHCVDCHFDQDGHGTGKLHGGYVEAIEITCIDCHGGVKQRATLRTSGLAAPEGGRISRSCTLLGDRDVSCGARETGAPCSYSAPQSQKIWSGKWCRSWIVSIHNPSTTMRNLA